MAYVEKSVYGNVCFIANQYGSKRSLYICSRSGRFTFRERATVTHLIGGWVGLRFGLGILDKKKSLGL
jgi:hypothetical protein